MWRRVYLFLALVRLYFALSPSYIHPDEHFQGPEVIAGDIFDWRITKTWEFTSAAPIRSVFPLWAAYGIPMHLVRWIMPGDESPSPMLVFYSLRILFFLISFVLEDWAIQELIASPRGRRISLLLLASSYVTWTYQTHTFSNSIETIGVAWSLVLIRRISSSKDTAWLSSAALGFTVIFSIFNRITFPAFLLLPGLTLIPHFLRHPTTVIPLVVFGLGATGLAIYLDTVYYSSSLAPSLYALFSHPLSHPLVITPLNNLLYNSKSSNLSLHGLHPRYTHILINLPQLLGPALISLFTSWTWPLQLPLLSAVSGIAVLSVFQHQEARFLIPLVPLLLSSISLPKNIILQRLWIVSWVMFNVVYGALMGIFHQGGVVPVQLYMGNVTNAANAVWWKTYQPPTWLLGEPLKNGNIPQLLTTDLMGAKIAVLVYTLKPLAQCDTGEQQANNYLVAPLSAVDLDEFSLGTNKSLPFWLKKEWEYQNHFNMDDMDFGDDGFLPTIERVVGRRGLGVWKVVRTDCPEKDDRKMN